MTITEYVGKEGVRSSSRIHSRLEHPEPGDLIRWANGTVGRVWEVASGFAEADEAHVCEEMGSAFLGLSDGRPYVSISGGPFCMVKLADLRPTYTLAPSPVWNWGDNMPGAGQGVHYVLHRPVFEYVGERGPR